MFCHPLVSSLIWCVFENFLNKKFETGLRWLLSGKESTCQCKRHRFDAQPGRIPLGVVQLSWRAATEPVLWSPGAALLY